MIMALSAHIQWLLALHIMAFISWMAGMFYLPRLFVYHTQIQIGTGEYARFCLMERRLLRQIMTPAMIVTVLTGGIMACLPSVIDWSASWWWVKLAAVCGLFAFHGFCARWRREFANDKNTRSEEFYRFANEVPTFLMALIVIMIIVRP